MNDREIRAYTVEFRIDNADADGSKIVGHAAVFDALSSDLGGFREKIQPGAFADSIDQDDVRALFNHSSDVVLGRTTAGTLRLSEDETGLLAEIDPPDTQAARDLMTSIARGDIDQMSFGFRVNPDGDEWRDTDDGVIRTLTSVRLFDVSPVTFPAYPTTDVGLRSLDAYRQQTENQASRIAADRDSRSRRLRMLAIE